VLNILSDLFNFSLKILKNPGLLTSLKPDYCLQSYKQNQYFPETWAPAKESLQPKGSSCPYPPSNQSLFVLIDFMPIYDIRNPTYFLT